MVRCKELITEAYSDEEDGYVEKWYVHSEVREMVFVSKSEAIGVVKFLFSLSNISDIKVLSHSTIIPHTVTTDANGVTKRCWTGTGSETAFIALPKGIPCATISRS